MFCKSFQILLLFSLFAGPVGCVYQGRLSIRRVWADLNTLNQPALFYEKIDHLPYHAAKVDHFRWMYNKGPNPRVPYQVVPDGVLDEGVITLDCETLECEPLIIEGEPYIPPNAPPALHPQSKANPESKPTLTPGGSSIPGPRIPPSRKIPASGIEDRLPPKPTFPPRQSGAGVAKPAVALQAVRMGELRTIFHRDATRPSMMSNRSAQLQHDEETDESQRQSPPSRVKRWFLRNNAGSQDLK